MVPTASLDANEALRLAALDSLRIVGTPRTWEFESVLALALQVTGCEAGCIGLMEADRHWFKAEVGMGLTEIARQLSIGHHILDQSEPLIVEDLAADPRFAGHPAVTERGLRFYAGIALGVEGGFKVGTLCLVDRSARRAPAGLAVTLAHFAKVIEGLLQAHAQARMATALAAEAEARERDLWKKTRLFEQAQRLAKIGAWEMDIATQAFYMSDEGYRINEADPDTLPSMPALRERMTPDVAQRAAALYQRCLDTGQGYEYCGEFTTLRGNKRWKHVIVETERRDGKVVRIFGTNRDVTAEHMAEQKLWHAAHYDVLTEAPNRYYWTLRLDEAFARATAERSGLTILMLDLDRFKEINDTRGHATGDVVLRDVTQRLKDSLPHGAFLARLGGDEFAILIESPGPTAEIEAMARTLLAAIRRPIVVQRLRLQISGTFGCASFPADASTASDLMQKADIALYQAKRSHRSSLVSFRPEIGGTFDDKRRAIDLVAVAIEQNRLVPYYQPKVDLKTGLRVGFEALCRIEEADGTVLGPVHFLAALQDPATSASIGLVMLASVTADIAAWRAAGLDPGRVAINVAGSDFADGQFERRVLDRLAMLSIPPATLEIEVTENTVLGKEAEVVGLSLRILKDHGILISLDDFGTGFASLTHLRDAPIQSIKLDRSFIGGLGQGVENAIIVKSIVELGHDLSMRIVAEGIETDEQSVFLRRIGCDDAQGFLFGHPSSRVVARTILEGERGSDYARHSRIPPRGSSQAA